ncbi:hypothetical protein B7P43_G16773 [Cryptotermes secundus]|uniref:Ig-like domain-containing protein n=1 Tax=Cryptotermes secundus TaxID=105785 RepID=A0A2J7PBF8_9NEOP|nr:hypothetical protein B7P43_G16773 [Cryptotermes secundus]
MIKSRRMRWAGHVARMGETRNAYRILVGKPEGRDHKENQGVAQEEDEVSASSPGRFIPGKQTQVSWIRKRDLHILTAGILTYTSDARFQVIRPDKSDNWTLQIKFPQERDSGIYECQVNTEPKMSLAFRLNVIGK